MEKNKKTIIHDMLAKMLAIVNLSIDSFEDFYEGWNKGITWTEEQQLEYVRWAVWYCKKTLRINRVVASKFVSQFLSNYGFEVVKNVENNERN